MRKRLAPAAALLFVASLAPGAAAQCGGCPPAGGAIVSALPPGFVPLGGFAQPRPPLTVGTPYLPDPAALERLNLRIDWVGYVPVGGARDGLATVQVADERQIFVQTESGLLIAIDAVTGAKQWAVRYLSTFVNLYPVGWNDDYVFAVNVARLYAINRLTGAVAFDYELPGSATAGPAADEELIYVVTSGNRLTGYRFPTALLLTAAARPTGVGGGPPRGAADIVADRFTGPGGAAGLYREPEFAANPLRSPAGGGIGLGPTQLTPSVSALPSVTPPYTIANRGVFATPSLTVTASLRQPYEFRPQYLRYNQQTPSISVLPPSVARAAEYANFAPRGPEPTVAWSVLATNRIMGQPILTDRGAAPKLSVVEPAIRRVWVASDGRGVQAFDRRNGTTVIDSTLQDNPAAPLDGPVALAPDRVLAFASLSDGNVVAIDLLRGGGTGPRIDWRTPVGGLLNHKPVATRQSLYVHGSQAGVSRLDVTTGTLVWKTADSADQYLAANDEFVYVRDRNGDLLVYDRHAVPPTRRLDPLARLPLPGYGVPIANDRTDRILLASDSGIVISLRDASPKYALPARLVPRVPPVAAKKSAVPPTPAPMPPKRKKGEGI